MDPIARHVYISGLVQGVSYRATTRRRANELGLQGWVRNLEDGRVEAFVQGSPERVDALLTWCNRGPERARVEALETHEAEPDDELRGFAILDDRSTHHG